MQVHLVGDGPAIEAARAQFDDEDLEVAQGDPGAVAEADLAVVSGLPGDDVLTAASESADETPWIAVEVGGVGGEALEAVDAAVTVFGDACYECLQTRVEAAEPARAASPSGDRSAVRVAGSIAGHEGLRVLSGSSEPLDTVVELPHVRRSLLPVPGCCADRHDPAPSTDFTDRPLEETVERAERAVDPRIGPITMVGEAESFPAPYYLAQLASTGAFSDASVPEQAAGVHDDWNAAYVKAVGEGLERYGSSVYRTDDLRAASPADLDGVVPPAAFAGADEDAPGADSDERRLWIRGEGLLDEASVWLPAQAVLFPPPESPDLPSITTGLGLGSSPGAALVSGLTEVIERDATMCSWYSTFDPLELVVEDESFERLERRARSEELTVTPLLVTQDVDVPVVTVAVHRPDDWPQFAVGSASALDPVTAAYDALNEAIQNWMELRSVGRQRATSLSGEIGHYASFPEAARSFVDVDERVPATSVGPTDPPTGGDVLSALLDRVDDAGLLPYATRLTTGDVESLGFEVVRVLVPAAQPLFTDTARFGDRARTVPEALGFEPRLDREHHPYP